MTELFIRFDKNADAYVLVKVKTQYVDGVGIQSDQFVIAVSKWWLVIEVHVILEKIKRMVGR